MVWNIKDKITKALNHLSAGTVDVAADSIIILDDTDGSNKKESIADLATAMAGTGVGATNGVFSVTPTEAAAATIADGDFIIFLDGGTTGVYSKGDINDVATLLAGGATTGITSASSILQLNINGMTAAVIDVTADSIAILDATDSLTKLESVDDVVSAVAGAGLVNTASQLAVGAGTLIDVNVNDVAVDLSEATEAVLADGDYLLFLDGGVAGTAAKEALADIVALIAGGATSGIVATSSVLQLNINGMTAAVVDVAADSIAILDATDAATKLESIADFVGVIVGASTTGISASSGVISLELNGIDSATIADGDSLVFLDVTDNSTKLELLADLVGVIAGSAGSGLTAASSVLQVNINGMTAAVVDVAADSIAILDATDSLTKLESVADLATGFAGASTTGILATSGVLSLELNGIASAVLADGDSLVFLDVTDNSTKLELLADLATLFAGGATSGITTAASVLQLNINGMTTATLDPTADSIAFLDATDSLTKIQTADGVVTALFGDGLQNIASQFAVNVSDFAGVGLSDDGSENLDIDEDVIRLAEVSISAAEIRALAGTAIELVAAEAGKIIVLDKVLLIYDYGSEVFAEPTAPDDMVIEYATGQDWSADVDATNFITAGNDESRLINRDMTAFPLTTDLVALVNSKVQLKNTGGEYTGNASNDGVIRVKTWYKMVTTGL